LTQIKRQGDHQLRFCDENTVPGPLGQNPAVALLTQIKALAQAIP
jgi:hypothetical protein